MNINLSVYIAINICRSPPTAGGARQRRGDRRMSKRLKHNKGEEARGKIRCKRQEARPRSKKQEALGKSKQHVEACKQTRSKRTEARASKTWKEAS